MPLTKMPLADEKSWKNLKDLHAKLGSTLNMRQLFAEDSGRFDKHW